MFKKFICCFLVIILCFCFIGCKEKQSTNIYDSNGKIVVSIANINSFSGNESAYLDVVVSEACKIISKVKSCDEATAKKQLDKYNVYTYLDADITSAIAESYSENISGTNFGCAITNLSGKLIAAYSVDTDNSQNFALSKMQQHSSMKPLSVYAPAIESGVVNWSTVTVDSPYKKITAENNKQYDWPSNANGKYSNENITVYEAIKQSLNTVAVKVLSHYGVNNSIDFLQKSFGIDVSYEQYKATIYGEDEVIGNIALGATQAGSSPIEMASYYQIFANGGCYTAPTAIKQITDADGNVVYKDTSTSTQVISAETSYIMNELLRGVITRGGTGADAYVENIETAGKTGTGDNFADNWFVGITPEYSCAVWHSNLDNKNLAPKLFSSITKKAKVENSIFMTSPNVKKYIYCADSGMLLGNNCKKAEMGYFTKDNPPASCNMH